MVERSRLLGWCWRCGRSFDCVIREVRESLAQDDDSWGTCKRAVGRSPDAHPNDDEAVVRMGHPDCADTRGLWWVSWLFGRRSRR